MLAAKEPPRALKVSMVHRVLRPVSDNNTEGVGVSPTFVLKMGVNELSERMIEKPIG